MPPIPETTPAAPPVDPAVTKRLAEIASELSNIQGAREKADEELAVALASSPAAKQALVDQLQARATALLAEQAKLTPPPPPDKSEVDKATASLKSGGWTETPDGRWVNTVQFKYGAPGETNIVPVGVVRSLGDAATLESQRPK